MTTGLVSGMSLEEAGQAVMRKAIEARGDGALGVWTEVGNRSVPVGISRRDKAATTVLIPRAEYDGMKLLELLRAG